MLPKIYWFLHLEFLANVVVQFYAWFNFDFPLFFCMVIYDNTYQTKKNPN